MSAIDQQIIAVTRTCYGVFLQTIKQLGLPFTLIANTTLNEKLGFQAGVAPNASEIPNMQYLAIGNMGHTTVVADDGSHEAIPVPHRSKDAAPYNMIPLVLRETTDDLTQAERERFRGRVLETHGGKQYYAYYLLRLPLQGVTSQLQRIEVIDGVATVTNYVPTTDDLNPTPPQISNSGVVLGSNDSVSASTIVTVNLDAAVIAEILNAHLIRTGSARSPVISELALVSGVDRDVQGSSGSSGSFMYKEVIAAQVNVFISTNHPIGYSSNKATFTLDVGGTEPTLAEQGFGQATWL